jgi:hypothetical protein
MENCTVVSGNNSCVLVEETSVLSEPGFAAFSLSIILIELVGLILVVLSIASLCCNVAVPRLVATFLLNQLGACLVFHGFVGSVYLVSLVLTLGNSLHPPPLQFCQFLIWGVGFGGVGRMWSLTAFSVVIFVTVKHGKKVFRLWHMVVGVTTVWVVAFVFNFHIILPFPVYAVQFVDNVVCFPSSSTLPRAIRYPILAIWVLAGGIIPLTISITIPVVTLCYIKRHTIMEGADYSRKIAKFALFLVIGNAVNLLGQAVLGLLGLYAEAPGVVVAGIVTSLSLLPTPIVVIVFLKPVRKRMKRILYCTCVGHRRKSSDVRNMSIRSTRGSVSCAFQAERTKLTNEINFV